MDQIEVDIILDVCPGHIHITSPCWYVAINVKTENFTKTM